jgi:hypothetical protein
MKVFTICPLHFSEEFLILYTTQDHSCNDEHQENLQDSFKRKCLSAPESCSLRKMKKRSIYTSAYEE